MYLGFGWCSLLKYWPNVGRGFGRSGFGRVIRSGERRGLCLDVAGLTVLMVDAGAGVCFEIFQDGSDAHSGCDGRGGARAGHSSRGARGELRSAE